MFCLIFSFTGSRIWLLHAPLKRLRKILAGKRFQQTSQVVTVLFLCTSQMAPCVVHYLRCHLGQPVFYCSVISPFILFYILIAFLSCFVARLRNIETLSNLLRSVIILSPGKIAFFVFFFLRICGAQVQDANIPNDILIFPIQCTTFDQTICKGTL